MTVGALAALGERIAIGGAGQRFEERLRHACGLRGPATAPPALRIGYCGHDFRSYGWMRIEEAAAFFARIAPVDSTLLAEYLSHAGLEAGHDTRRMKTAYQRALVLGIQASLQPDLIVVERAEQFDEPRPAALLREIISCAPRAIVTYGQEIAHRDVFTRTASAP